MSPGLKDRLVTTGRTAVVIGAVALLGILAVDAVKAIGVYRLLYPETTLEQQATTVFTKDFLSTDPPSERDKLLYRLESATGTLPEKFFATVEEELKRLLACKSIIKQHAQIRQEIVTSIPLTAVPYFTSAPCFFHDPSARPNIIDVV